MPKKKNHINDNKKIQDLMLENVIIFLFFMNMIT